jgi:beta-galactosidase/beta-glucuronidase
VEACLSGVAPVSSAAYQDKMFYRLVFDAAADADTDGSGKTLLHFGAVDWQSSVYLNGALLGNHTGGYDGFSFEVALKPAGNELLVYAFDPSDQGDQPNGKQRISAISSPGGDTYTPSSGIWQTVWLEQVPAEFIESLKIDQASTSVVTVTARVPNFMSGTSVRYVVTDAAGRTVASATGASNAGPVTIAIPAPQLLWSPAAPHLYDLTVTLSSGDAVTSYFGLRTFALGEGPKGKRPLLNGNFTFLAGFLDQSWWPDGQYTAPTDEALAYDVRVVPMYVRSLLATCWCFLVLLLTPDS